MIWPVYVTNLNIEKKLTQHHLLAKAVYEAGGHIEVVIQVHSRKSALSMLQQNFVIRREMSSPGQLSSVWIWANEESARSLKDQWKLDQKVEKETGVRQGRYFAQKYNRYLLEQGEVRVVFIGGRVFQLLHIVDLNGTAPRVQHVREVRRLEDVP